MLAASTARAAGTVGRHGHRRIGRHIEHGLMRMKREHRASGMRAALERADRGVAVFHREREVARHERRAHALVCSDGGTRPAATSASVPRLIAP